MTFTNFHLMKVLYYQSLYYKSLLCLHNNQIFTHTCIIPDSNYLQLLNWGDFDVNPIKETDKKLKCIHPPRKTGYWEVLNSSLLSAIFMIFFLLSSLPTPDFEFASRKFSFNALIPWLFHMQYYQVTYKHSLWIITA